MFTHHLTQPPQQEAHTDIWGAREVELVAQSRRKDKIIHVWGKSAERKKKDFGVQCSHHLFLLFHTKVCLC